jgi:hypothetical protein
MLVTLDGSRSLSGTFFWLIITAAAFDLTPIVVIPVELMALKAYSVVRKVGCKGLLPTW